MPKKKSSTKKSAAATKSAAAKASKRSKAWAKRVATKYETPKKVGKKRTGAVGKKRKVTKTGGGKDGPGVVIDVADDVDELEDDAGDDDDA